MDKHDPAFEEIRVRGADLAAKVGDLLQHSNVRRVIIRDDSENTLMEIPVSGPAPGGSTAPVLTAVGALSSTMADFHVVVLRTEHVNRDPAKGTGTSRVGATEDQMNTQQMVAQRIDNRGTRVEDLAGTGEHDAPGG